MVAAAIIGSAVVGGVVSSSASRRAANAQITAAKNANQTVTDAQGQIRNDLLPYSKGGTASYSQLLESLGPNGPLSRGAGSYTPFGEAAPVYSQFGEAAPIYHDFNMTQANLEATPGYQFNLSQGLKAVQNSASARGLGISGAAQKGAARFASGLADSTYQNQLNNYMNQFNVGQQGYQNRLTNYMNQFNVGQQGYQNRLANYMNQFNTGFNADTANQTNLYNRLLGSSQLGESAAAQTGSFGTTNAQTLSGNITGAGNAAASGIVGGANAITGALGSIPGALVYNNLFPGSGGGGTGFGGLYGSGATAIGTM